MFIIVENFASLRDVSLKVMIRFMQLMVIHGSHDIVFEIFTNRFMEAKLSPLHVVSAYQEC